MAPKRHPAEFAPIASAAALLLKCAGFIHDERDTEQGWEVIYAIDVDVIQMHLSPQDNSSYANVFGRRERSDTVESLAFLLSDFLFESNEDLLTYARPRSARFLLIPPHDKELVGALQRKYRNLKALAQETISVDFTSLVKLLDDFRKSDDNDERKLHDLAQGLKNNVPDLVELYNPFRGVGAELARFGKLADDTFLNIDNHPDPSLALTTPELLPVESRKEVGRMHKGWVERLKEANPSKSSAAVHIDAAVLARIEFTNQMLAKEKRRITLITGADYMYRASRAYFPSFVAGRNLKRSFDSMCLRHPLAFLAHSSFFAEARDQASPSSAHQVFKLVEWLNLFFPKALSSIVHSGIRVNTTILEAVESGDDPELSRVITTLRNAEATDPGSALEDLIDLWRAKITASAAERYGVDGLQNASVHAGASALKLAERLGELTTGTGTLDLDALRKQLEDDVLSSVSHLYSTAVWVGLWSTVKREHTKGVPALRFDGKYHQYVEYCNRIIELQLSASNSLTQAEMREVRALCEHASSTDPSLYHVHIIHALAFAAKGHWQATLTLCNVAIQISDHLIRDLANEIDSEDPEIRRGREASYLAAIACRRMARDGAALDLAHLYLQKAIARETPGAQNLDIRFRSEALAIETRRLFFSEFVRNENRWSREDLLGLLDSWDQIARDTTLEDDPWVVRWISYQALVNFFSVLLVLRLHDSAFNPDANYLIEGKLIQFESLKNQGELREVERYDSYAWFVYNIAMAIWGPTDEEREAAKKRAFDLQPKLPDYSPYDENRRKKFSGLLPALKSAARTPKPRTT